MPRMAKMTRTAEPTIYGTIVKDGAYWKAIPLGFDDDKEDPKKFRNDRYANSGLGDAIQSLIPTGKDYGLRRKGSWGEIYEVIGK